MILPFQSVRLNGRWRRLRRSSSMPIMGATSMAFLEAVDSKKRQPERLPLLYLLASVLLPNLKNKVVEQRAPHPGGDGVNRCPVVGMVHADGKAGAILQRPFHRRRKFEAQEMHRRSLFLVFPLQVFVGNRVHPRMTCDPDPDAVFYSYQPRQRDLALLDVGVLDQHGGLPVAAVGDQRVVGIELVANTLLLEYALDPQHLLDLVAHGEFVLEHQRDVLARSNRPVLLVGQYFGAEFLARLRVLFERHQAFGGNDSHLRPLAGVCSQHPGLHNPYAMRIKVRGWLFSALPLSNPLSAMPCLMWRPAMAQSELT